MSIAFPLLSGAAGAAAGWFVSWIVDRTTGSGDAENSGTDVYVPNYDQRSLNRNWGHIRLSPNFLMILSSAILVAALSVKFQTPNIRLFVYAGLVLVLIGVTVFDIRKQKIPHVVTIPGAIAGLFLGSRVLPLGIRESLLGLAVGAGILLAASLVEAIRKKEIGGGDWKYAAMIGSFIGPQRIVLALVLTGIFGFVGAIVLALSGNHGRPQALGPWLSAGAVASILLG